MEEINCGVPQGFSLGPLSLLVYINDFRFCLQSSEATIYGDSTTISCSSKTVGELNVKLDNDLYCLEEWVHGNRLAINVIKAQAMIVGSRPNLGKITSNASAAPCIVIGILILILLRVLNILELNYINTLFEMNT